ncbi:MAG TPA: glycosyl transferase family 2 [Bacteroidales bacterium]|nr:glycosyl transferase family 2 [Bacteroidales bacterium]
MEQLVLWEKFLKFGIVGLSGVGVDFGITYISKEKLSINRYISNSMGFVAAATSNYILNRIWTFESHSSQIVIQYALFMMIAIGGLTINNFVIYILNQRTGWMKFYLAKVLATGAVFLWNFTLNYLITFSN